MEEVRGSNPLSSTSVLPGQVAFAPPARRHAAHWYGWGGSRLAIAIREAGWRAANLNIADERVAFARVTEADELDTTLIPWGHADDDVEAAQYMCSRLSSTARRMIEILIAVAPDRVAALELAES